MQIARVSGSHLVKPRLPYRDLNIFTLKGLKSEAVDMEDVHNLLLNKNQVTKWYTQNGVFIG